MPAERPPARARARRPAPARPGAAGEGSDGSALGDEDVARGWLCGQVPPAEARSGGGPGPSPATPALRRGAVPAPLRRGTALTPRQALDAVMAEALAAPPCLVAFSGGRDSSLLLAAAVDVARRHRLPSPVAVTERFDDVAGTEESRWQERVVRHLGVADWERVAAADHIDLLGPVATASLRRHGLLWPPLVHTRAWYLPALLDQGGGRDDRRGGRARGTLVDGEGGDEVLGPRRTAPLLALAGRRSGVPGRRDRRTALAAARAVAPRALRRSRARRAAVAGAPAPWLRPAAADAFARALADDAAAEPLDWGAATRRHLRRRSVVVGMAALDRVVGAAGARAVHPLLHPLVVEALAVAGGRAGYASRTAALASCFGPLLPDDVLRRPGKATFTLAAFGAATRRFAAAWDGRGLPDDLVDPDALAAAWALPEPSALSFTALHAAWLAGPGSAP